MDFLKKAANNAQEAWESDKGKEMRANVAAGASKAGTAIATGAKTAAEKTQEAYNSEQGQKARASVSAGCQKAVQATKDGYNSEQGQQARAAVATGAQKVADGAKGAYNSEQGQQARATAAAGAAAAGQKMKDGYNSEQGQKARASVASGAATAGKAVVNKCGDAFVDKAVDGGALKSDAAHKATQQGLNAAMAQATGGKVKEAPTGMAAGLLDHADKNRDQTKGLLKQGLKEAAK